MRRLGRLDPQQNTAYILNTSVLNNCECSLDKGVTIENVTSQFSATGIYPYKLQTIPGNTFSISHGAISDRTVTSTSCPCENRPIHKVSSDSRSNSIRLLPVVISAV